MPSRALLWSSLLAVALLGVAAAAQAFVANGHSGWAWVSPAPQGETIRAVEVQGSVAYAAGDSGTLLRSVDGGRTWAGLATGLEAGLVHVAITGPDSVVVAGRCAVRRSDDAGLHFTRLPVAATDQACAAPIVAVAFPTGARGYVLFGDGTVLRTDDGGAAWVATARLPAPDPTGAAFRSAAAGVVTTASGAIYRTIDAGLSWTLEYSGTRGLRAVRFATALAGYAVGEGATVVQTLDGGATWLERGGETPLTLTSIRCGALLVCLATTDTGDRLLRTTDGGRTFQAIAGTGDILAAALDGGSQAVAAGILGRTIVSGDAGVTWAAVGARPAATLTRLRARSAGFLFAAGRSGRVARTLDGGATWQTFRLPTRLDVTDVSFAGAEVGWALDLAGRVFRTSDGGATWSRVRPRTGARPQAVLAPTPRSVILVGPHSIFRSVRGGRFRRVLKRIAHTKVFEVDRARGALFAHGSRRIAVSVNGGKSWKRVLRPRRALLASVDFVTRRIGYLLEQDGRLWKTRNGGRTWHDLAAIGTDDAVGLAFASPTDGYLVLSRFGDDARGYVLRTSDGGRTWRPQLVTDRPLAPGVVARRSAAFALASDGSVFQTASGGDRGSASRVTLETRHRRVRRAARVVVAGRVEGVAAGSVLVARRLARESGWEHRLVPVAADGTFATAWRLTRSATFVAQWAGDAQRAGDGSKPFRITVRR